MKNQNDKLALAFRDAAGEAMLLAGPDARNAVWKAAIDMAWYVLNLDEQAERRFLGIAMGKEPLAKEEARP